MELIIKISDKMFDTFKQHGIMTFDNLDEYDRDMVADAITNGIPYNPSGDLISREALKEHKVYSEERHEYVVPVYNIDNAQAIPLPSNQIAWEQGYEAGLAQGKQDNAPTVEPVIKCLDCKFYRKKWFVDRRMKEKGYWNCWCECHDYWVGGENGFCSLAEKKGGAE